MQNPFLIGERVYLRALEETDITEAHIGWLNDPEVTRYLAMTGKYPATASGMESWLEKFRNNTTNLGFAILDKTNDRHIGNITLDDINWIHRTADISLMIGDKEYWGSGYATETQSLLIEYAFHRLGLHKVLNSPVADHVGSVKMAKNLGFQVEGTLREQLFIEGEYHDQLRMGLFAHEFKKFVFKERKNN